jgi:cytidine deaminase
MTASVPKPLCYRTDIPDEGTIISWLRDLRRNAYVPGSSYQVAVVMMMKVGAGYYFFGGVNAESAEHRLSLHGEESAIAALATAFGKRAVIDAVWLMAAPDYLTGPAADSLADVQGQTCGNCRQQISGLAIDRNIPICAISLNGQGVTDTIETLLPKSFSFGDFDPGIAARRAQDRLRHDAPDHAVIENRLLRTEPQDKDSIFSWLSDLESIDYASGQPQAVVLSLSNGAFVAGVRVENAAYTGLNAVQAAIGIASTAFGNVGVTGVHILSGLYPPSLAALQILRERITDRAIPVTLYSGAGEAVTMPFNRMPDYAFGFKTPPMILRDGGLFEG